MSAFTYGEVCAGVGGLSRGLEAAGMECRFHAEIAAFPRRVLAHHWPDTPLLSDLNAISGGRKMRAWMCRHFAGLTLLAGGTPCQDLSVAGKRAGIAGARSSLYFRFVRLWKVLDCPYILWENVAGALSSNRGADFAAVLSAIVGGTVPVPSQGWSRAGVVAGPTGVAAWRLLDAQWFGVPQRRLRVFVLGARAGGVDPAEVLLEPQGVRRHPPTRDQKRERVADSLTVGANQTCGFPGDDVSGEEGSCLAFDWQKGNDVTNRRPSTMNVTKEQTGTLGSTRVPAVLSFGWQNAAAQGDDVTQGSVAPLRTGTTPAVMAFQNTGQGWWNDESVAQTLRAASGDSRLANVVCTTGDATHAVTHEGHDASEDGTGRGTPIVAYFDKQRIGEYGENGVASTVSARDYKDATDLILEPDNGSRLDSSAPVPAAASDARAVCLLRQADGAEAVQRAAGGFEGVCSPEVLRCEVHGCGFRRTASEGGPVVDDGAPSRPETLSAGSVCALRQAAHGGASQGRGLAEQRSGEPGAPVPRVPHTPPSLGVPRRLMPIETERLMSWPDGWTNISDEKGKPTSDAARYKACGNGVVSNVAEWIGARLLAVHTAMTKQVVA